MPSFGLKKFNPIWSYFISFANLLALTLYFTSCFRIYSLHLLPIIISYIFYLHIIPYHLICSIKTYYYTYSIFPFFPSCAIVIIHFYINSILQLTLEQTPWVFTAQVQSYMDLFLRNIQSVLYIHGHRT